MRNSIKVASSLLLFVSLAHADQPAYQGKWTGSATNSTGAQVQVALEIKQTAGKLRLSQSSGYVTRDECLDRDIPVAITSQTDSEMIIAIQGEKALRGCIDETATLKLVDPKTLQATLKDGRSMKLTHK